MAAPVDQPPVTPEERLCTSSAGGDTAEVTSLLSSGADPSYFDPNGMTPLMHAASHGRTAIVRLLLDAGAPWNALTPSGLCAGDLAMDGSHQETVDLLLGFAVQAELILGTITRSKRDDSNTESSYLDERVAFSEDRIMDTESKAVMMSWEKPLMEAHARAVCTNGGRVLNVGFGMGIVDEAIERYEPEEHTIIEAHPDVYARMLKSGWGEKKNVKIVFGRWQDVLPQLGTYDGIFFDTYGEYYEDMREFHQHLPKLLRPGGIYSYFNGLCGDNAFFHVVYCQLVSLELANLGFSTQFVPLPVKDCLSKELWEGVRQKYWQLDTYYLPVCQADSDSDDLN
ncbi:Protein arginine N-methyltransferase 2 [Rhynchospora pubera]|uniref:Protein arginine N-methyltransferase 2 n=1 Tax=Rhynchospora pubera TaxID=906938 RepID=A0AAV8GDD0_9POAL|nr:Protein arginine N-methyltransferase 2 [Rhynchospora pubera]